VSKSKAQKTVQRKRKLINRQRRIRYRLRDRQWEDQVEPMFKANSIHYDLSDRVRGLDCGGIGV